MNFTVLSNQILPNRGVDNCPVLLSDNPESTIPKEVTVVMRSCESVFPLQDEHSGTYTLGLFSCNLCLNQCQTARIQITGDYLDKVVEDLGVTIQERTILVGNRIQPSDIEAELDTDILINKIDKFLQHGAQEYEPDVIIRSDE